MENRIESAAARCVLLSAFLLMILAGLSESSEAQTFSCPIGQVDVMKYFAMNAQKRPIEFVSGTANPIYTQVFPNQDFGSGGYWLWLKSSTAHGFDVKAFDQSYVYMRSTELIWTDNTTFKRFEHDLPIAARCVTSGKPGPVIRVANTTFKYYSSCASYKSSTLGTSVNSLDAPLSMNAGGNLGTLWTRVLHYRYNCNSTYQNCNDEEQFYLGNGYGLWQWKHYHAGLLAKTALMNKITLGTATGTLPCSDSYN